MRGSGVSGGGGWTVAGRLFLPIAMSQEVIMICINAAHSYNIYVYRQLATVQ